MNAQKIRFLSLILALTLLPVSVLCGCRDEPDAGIITDTGTAAADTAAEPVTHPATQPDTTHACSFDALGLCRECGRTQPVTVETVTPAASLPHDALWYEIAAKYKMQLTTTLSLSGDGRYTVTKRLSDVDDPGKTYAVFAFGGSCTADAGTVTLAVPDTGTADVDLSDFCHVRYRADSTTDPTVLDAFPTGYLCGCVGARPQTVTADGEGVRFLSDDCTHPAHGDDLTCTACGRAIPTKLKGCDCTMCTEETGYAVKKVPAKYLSGACPEKGRVDKIVYDSYNYATKSPYTNTVFIYLPYGYDEHPDMEYNVLYLLHGSGENAAYWLAQLSYKGGYTEVTKCLLDNLHYYKLCEPTIVVTPTENLNGTANFWREMEDYIIPLIETRYRTKAGMYGREPADFKPGDMVLSRTSRAFAGLSLGSIITWDVMSRSLDKYAYYGFYSGGTCSGDRKIMLRRTLRNKDNEIYDIRFAYHSCGTADVMYADHAADYRYFLKESDRLREGENTVFLDKPGFGHNFSSWIIDLYNTMAFDFFKH